MQYVDLCFKIFNICKLVFCVSLCRFVVKRLQKWIINDLKYLLELFDNGLMDFGVCIYGG